MLMLGSMVPVQAIAASPDSEATTVSIRVEGPNGQLYDFRNEVVEAENVYDATLAVFENHNVVFEAGDGYVGSIAGVETGTYKGWDGWNFATNLEVYSERWAGDEPLEGVTEIVWYYGGDGDLYPFEYGNTIEEITFTPLIEVTTDAVEENDLEILITGQYRHFEDFAGTTQGIKKIALKDVLIKFNNDEYHTDENGKVTIPSEKVKAGIAELEISKYVQDSYPRVVRTTKEIIVKQKEEVPNQGEVLLEKTKQSVAKAVDYYKHDNNKISERVSGSHSGYWSLTPMWSSGVDLKAYPWVAGKEPTNESSYWNKERTKPVNMSNEDAGTIIGASILGMDPTNMGSRDIVQDLLDRQKEDGLFNTTIWGQSWALIALDLVDAKYNQGEHIDALLKIQSDETGSFGPLDSTGWMLMALAPHSAYPGVEEAIQKAVAGYHESFQEKGFIDNSNTMATIISGLASVGEDLYSEKWTYEKDGQKVNIVGHLVDNYQLQDGSFRWKITQNTSNLMATEQVFIALIDSLEKKSTFARLKEHLKESMPNEIDPIDKVDGMLSNVMGYYTNERKNLENYYGKVGLSWTEVVALNAVGYNLADGELEVPSWVTKDPDLKADTQNTEHIRYIYGLLALGENPSKAWETNRNLFAELAAQQKEDGSIGAINKHAWAMLALDAGEKLGYNVGNWNEEAKSKALTNLLSQEKQSGGFALSLDITKDPDADMTGMVLLALANYQDESAVNEAIERAKTALRVIQLDTAGWGSENSNSIATVISGLIAIGEDPLSESWMKGEYTPVDALMSYQLDNGAFTYTLGEYAAANQMATEQSLIAMQEIKTGKSIWQQLTVGNPGETDPKPEEPKKIIVEKDKPFELAVEDNDVAASPIILTFTNPILPSITAERAGAKLEIQEGTSITSDWNKELQAPTEQTTSLDNKDEIQNELTEKTLKRIGAHIKVGGDSPIVFDKYVTLQFKGLGNLEAGFIGSDGKFTLIPKKTNSISTEDVYAYTDGNDLIIKTKHFTEFIVFETEEKAVTPPTGGNDGTPQPSTKTVKFSIEKRTVDSTDIISEIPVTLNAGETAFTLLERIAAEKNISLSASGSGPSVYVESIGGLAEFHEGQQSGWMYSVNGVFPEYSAGSYILKDGDTLRWQYTKDLGKDVGGYVPDSGSGGGSTPTPTPTPEPEAPVKPLEFTDISKHWAKDYIQKAVQLGIFTGYSDKTFRPDNYLTRAQAVSVIVRALDMKTDEAAPFLDIGTYAKETQAEIAAAYKHGLIKKQDGKFSPSNEVTRAQMALMLHRAHEYKTGEKYVAAQRAPYTDFGGYNDEAINAISMLHELNIATGDKGKYLPSNSTSRAHVAKMLINSLEQ